MLTGNSVLHFEKLTKKAQKKVGSCFIWQLRLFKGFIISGDSQGDITVWDAEFGTLVKQFKHLKGDVNSLEVNEEFSSVYASGVDSRIVTVQLKDEREWVFSSIFRGQSHDIKSLVLLSNKQLLSGGVTTDICLYNLNNGRLGDQFGKNSKQKQSSPKLRHVPPFPFKQFAKFDALTSTITVQNGANRSLDIWSSQTFSQLLRIDTKGDYNMTCFDKHGHYIVYSDCKDTQVFYFDAETLQIQKLTKKIA